MEASFKKYTDTSRIISLLVHGVIVLGMAVVWVIFGILHTPFYFVGAKGSGSSTAETIASLAANGSPFYLHLELGVVALTLVLASCYGFFKALKSFKTQRDAEVVSAFTVLIAEGWLAAIFFLSQGLFLFDLLSTKDTLAFVIIMSIILAVIILIGTNIPMVRLYDGRDSSELLATIALVAGVFFLALAIETGAALLGDVISAAPKFRSIQSKLVSVLLIPLISGLIAGCLALFAGLKLKKEGAEKARGLAGYLGAGAVAVAGIGLVISGVFDLLWKDDACHFISNALVEGEWLKSNGLGYPIMSLIVGAVVIAGALFLLIAINKPAKAKKA